VRREIGADLADMTDGGGWAVACFGDLGLGHGGFRARVGVSEMRTPGATAGDVMCCGREVAAAQRDHAENAVRRDAYPCAPRVSAAARAIWPWAVASPQVGAT
jgi:hypothetical protein